MFIIIAGGGRIGRRLIDDQLIKQNEVAVIEKNPDTFQRIVEEFGSLAISGDASDPATLEKAGISRAEMIIAATDYDQDNLIICQMARKKFRVPITVAIVNNSENESVFSKLGVDMAINAVDAVIDRLEMRLSPLGQMNVLSKYDGLWLIEARMTSDSQASGKTMEQINLPDGCVLSAIIRGGANLPIENDLTVKSDDRLIFIAPQELFSPIRTELYGDENP